MVSYTDNKSISQEIRQTVNYPASSHYVYSEAPLIWIKKFDPPRAHNYDLKCDLAVS
jgi:hypothetical protein